MLLARRKGFEPLTPRFEVWCSIQLSYRRSAASLAQTAARAKRTAGRCRDRAQMRTASLRFLLSGNLRADRRNGFPADLIFVFIAFRPMGAALMFIVGAHCFARAAEEIAAVSSGK